MLPGHFVDTAYIYFLSLLGSTINIPLSKKPVETGDEYDEFLIDIDERYPHRDGESGSWIEKYEIDELIKTKKDKIKEILEEKIEELRELASERYIGKDGISMVDYLDEREYKKYEYYNNLLEGIKNGDRNR